MERALELAQLGRYSVSPNPMVGAVIVRDGVNVGEGFHHRAGQPHAEVEAIRAAGEKARGADIYVTLEPCCVQGRTPPCTDAIIAAGIRRVYVGATDPNPNVCGNGCARLRQAGVEVIEGVLSDDATWLNRAFNKWITTKQPWVTLKLATTLDGKTAAVGGASKWITSEPIRQHVHRLRASFDAIMVGSGTVQMDDPRLNVRNVPPLFEGGDYEAPLKVIIDSSAQTPINAKLFADGKALIATANANTEDRQALSQSGAITLNVPGKNGRVDIRKVLNELGSRSPKPVTSVFLEGGPTLAASMIQDNLVDELRLHIAPKIMGGDGLSALHSLGVLEPSQCPQLHIVEVNTFEPDIEIVATFG